jgi:hypothetical protein
MMCAAVLGPCRCDLLPWLMLLCRIGRAIAVLIPTEIAIDSEN